MNKIILLLFFVSQIIFSQNPCPGKATVTYQGKTYNTVAIGAQCWLKENLDVGTMIPGSQDQTDNDFIEKYCYKNDPANCEIYGGLYQNGEALDYIDIDGLQGICPSGFHIPTFNEYQILLDNTNNEAKELLALGQGKMGGFGNDRSGFSALLAGWRLVEGTFDQNGNPYRSGKGNGYAAFWTSSTDEYGFPYSLIVDSKDYKVSEDTFSADFGYSVRCVKD